MLTLVMIKSFRDVVILVDALDGIIGGEYVIRSLVCCCALTAAICATTSSLPESGTLI